MTEKKIPKSAVSRLSLYLRETTRLEAEGKDRISSAQLGELTGLTDAQVRKDLSYFGQFGISGSGYDIPKLKNTIHKILGKDRTWPIALVGVGNIGSALLNYPGFKKQGFIIKEAFDIDPKKIGRKFGGVAVKDAKELKRSIMKNDIKIAILSVPAENAQAVASTLFRSGIKCILNFAPVFLKAGNDALVRNIDLSNELENFSFSLSYGP